MQIGYANLLFSRDMKNNHSKIVDSCNFMNYAELYGGNLRLHPVEKAVESVNNFLYIPVENCYRPESKC